MLLATQEVYVDYLSRLQARRERTAYRLMLAKQATWLTLLSGGYLMLYLLELLQETFRLLGIQF